MTDRSLFCSGNYAYLVVKPAFECRLVHCNGHQWGDAIEGRLASSRNIVQRQSEPRVGTCLLTSVLNANDIALNMSRSDCLCQVLCRDLNPVSARTFADLKQSLFLEPDDPSARLEVYASDCEDGTSGLKPHSSRDVKITSLKEGRDLKRYVDATKGPQVFFIRQRNSYSPLAITHDLFETLLAEKCVSSQFRDYVLYMGEREREVEIAPSRLRWRPTSLSATGQDAGAFECMYGLRFIDLNGRGTPEHATSRWSLRQSAIYCSFNPGKDEATWIFVTPSQLAQQRLDEYLYRRKKDCTPDPFDVHLLLLDTAIANWRPYIVDLAAETDQHAAQLLGASPDDQGPINMKDCGERQALMTLDDKLLDASLAIKSTSDNVKSLLGSYKSIRGTQSEQVTPAYRLVTALCFEQLQELDLLSTRVDALRSRLKGITNLVSSFLDLSSGFALQDLAKESAKENEIIRDLTKKGTQDAAAVKVLTILTLIYLPATVVSNFFSTSFVNSEMSPGRSAHLVVSHDWWIFIAVSFPLTLFTLYVWWVWMRIQAYGTYPWWWVCRGGGSQSRLDPAFRGKLNADKV